MKLPVFLFFLLQLYPSALSFVIPQNDGVQMNPLKFAVDVSYKISADQMKCIANSGYQAVFIRGTDWSGTPDNQALTSIDYANQAGLATEIYMYVNVKSNVPVSTQFDNLINFLAGSAFGMERVWVVVDYSSGTNAWFSDPQQNALALQQLFNEIRVAWGMVIGVMTNRNDWNLITPKNFTIDRYDELWYSPFAQVQNSQQTPTNFSDYVQIGSWTSPSVKRYQVGQPLCGLTSVNRNVFVPAIIPQLKTLLPMAFLSWFDQQVLSVDQLNCFKNNNYYAVFLRIYNIGGNNTNIVDSAMPTILNAKTANLPVELFTIISSTSSTPINKQFQDVYDFLRSQNIKLKRIWIPVVLSSWFGSDVNQNVQTIQAFINRAYLNGVQVGILTTAFQWNSVTGGYSGFASSTLLWYSESENFADFDIPDNNFSDFATFGGWQSPSMKMYAGGNSLCGVDQLNGVIFDPSLQIGQNNMAFEFI